MKFLNFLSLPILFSSLSALATPTITNVTGVSYFETATGTTTVSAAYGGMAGTCASPSTTTTCNTCTNTATPAKACNPQSINPALNITVSFTSSAAVTNARVELQTEPTSTGGNNVLYSTTMSLSANGAASISGTWSSLCGFDSNFDSTCLPKAGVTATPTPFATNRGLIVWVDENGNGTQEAGETARVPIVYEYVDASNAALNAQTFSLTSCSGKGACGFTVLPGDSKFYVDQLVVSGGGSAPTKDSNAPDWLGVAFFGAGGASITSATVPSSGSPTIKKYDTSYGITDSSIEGFDNYTRYCLIMGNIDKAYNIYYFNTTGTDDTKTCGSPSEVVGVLEDKHCFISTAAFGSQMAPEVETFRQFRNNYLLTNSWGKKFVKLYYKYSPPAAEVITQSETLRSMTRGFLYPLLAFAYIALHYGILAAVLSLLVVLILLNAVVKTVFKNKKVLLTIVLLFSFNLRAEDYSAPRRIQHPGAADGLVRIDKEGNYIYDVKQTPKNQSSHIYFGQANNPEVSLTIDGVDSNGQPNGTKNTYNFDDFYKSSSKFIIGYDYEWYPWVEKARLGLQGGVGFMYADGHGRLLAGTPQDPNPESVEKFSFVTMPINLGAIYRFQYKDTQWVVPYVAGGGTYVLLAEKREDKSSPNFTGGFGFYGAGGLLLNLTKFDAETAFDLNNEYGIGNLWLSVELKATEVEADAFKFSTQYINAGFAFDF